MKRTAPDRLMDGTPFTVADAAALGVSRRRSQTSPLWRPVCRGIHVAAQTPDSVGLRIAATRLVVPPSCVIAGTSALWLHGVDVRRRPDDPVEVVWPAGTPSTGRGLLVARRAALSPSDVEIVAGIAVSSVLRSAFDVARGDLTEAVVCLDALRNRGLLDPAVLLAYAADHRGRRGLVTLRRAVRLSDAGAESPQESRLRMLLVLDAGLPRPVTQYELRDSSGYLIARFDLAYPESILGVDFHGRWHDQPRQRLKDSRRDNRVQGTEWTHLHYWGDDLAARRHVIVREVSAALGIESRLRHRSAC